MEREELRAWLRLVLTPHVGPVTARTLLRALGSPQAVWAAGPQAWSRLVAAREAAALAQMPPDLDAQCEATLNWLAAAPAAPNGEGGHHVLTLADPRYPARLLDVANPPLLLFAQGRLSLLQASSVAVVGSRHPTAQGADNARAFAEALSVAGLTVVSGLARGVDAAAHEGALTGAARCGGTASVGSTIAVVGTGLDQVYPKGHAPLLRRIAEHGLVLSEFVLGTGPLPSNFPKRNRLVAALSQGTLVVEAAVQSGSLITARLALEMGREVLAIPGSIHSPQSRGCHALIRQGAKLVETAQDVLEELHLQAPVGVPVTPAQTELAWSGGDEALSSDPVLAAMGYDPVSQEALSARTGWGPAELGARLLELELMGQVARLPGQLFQRVAVA
ncbi:MAG: DNA-processing protein DprA [Aquabacterium sp.]|jgi:DNA processing protein|uniref:DNA-processing protein DprA n=1 Tax=Aquabacterium sp. TaxID=1872578 RepID=UPI001B5F1146|nr:DNA-processing protein DprA [Aquabacterium sp.]MBP7131892.1 DNA-processing protein DprA [Aquabacterium sp.]MBP9062953.1 DNA-processing protein DprA [Aquabacterium sp.]MDQ5925457.1 processing protein [Pseudomonadota bacterium]